MEPRQNMRGATLVEYAMLVSLMAVVSIAASTQLGETAGRTLAATGNKIGQPPNSYVTIEPPATDVSAPMPAGQITWNMGDGSGPSPAPAPTTTTSTTTTTTTTVQAPPSHGRIVGVASDWTWSVTEYDGLWRGEWRGAMTFTNDTSRHMYVDMDVRYVWSDGREETQTVNGFYVPGGGTSTYENWANAGQIDNGEFAGVERIDVFINRVMTSDANWQPVEAPPFPGGSIFRPAVPEP